MNPTPSRLDIVWLEEPDFSLHGCDQLRRVVADPLLEHDVDVLEVGDARGRVAVQHDEVGLLAYCDGTDFRRASEKGRAVERADLDRLERREPALDEEFER